MQQAQGKWYFFADADDFLLENFYQKVQAYFDSDNDVVFFPPTSQQRDGSPSWRHINLAATINNYSRNPGHKQLLDLKFYTTALWIRLFNAKFIQDNKLLFDEVVVAEDAMFCTKASCCMKKFTTSQANIYCVTSGDDTLTTTYEAEIITAKATTFTRQCNYLAEKLSPSDMQQLDFNGSFIITQALTQHSLALAWKLYLLFRKNNISTSVTAKVFIRTMASYCYRQTFLGAIWRFCKNKTGG